MKKYLLCATMIFIFVVCLSIKASAQESSTYTGKIDSPRNTGTVTTNNQGNTTSDNSEFPRQLTVTSGNSGNSGQITLYGVGGSYYAASGAGGSYPHFGYKSTSNGMEVVCLSGLGVNAPPSSASCIRQDTWADEKNGYALGYILHTINSGSADAMTKYYFAELLAMYYLHRNNQYPFGVSSYGSGSTLYKNIVNSSSNLVPGTGKTFMQIINGAIEYADSVVTAEISTSKGDSVNLKFTLNEEDGYYYSNTITITSNLSFNVKPSNSKFQVVKSGKKYTFKINKDDVAEGGKESFTAKIKVSTSAYYGYRYNCSAGQDVMPMKYETRSSEDSVTIRGTVTREARPGVSIRKVNKGGTLLEGAKFEVLNSGKQSMACVIGNNNAERCQWDTTTDETVIYDLTDGKYYLREISAPKGYIKNNEDLEFTIENGKIKIGGQDNDYIEMVNEFSEVEISKKSVTGSDELPGASLAILDSNGKKISCTIKKDGVFVDKSECSWTSGTTPMKIYGLPDGTYYLEETVAPSGYKMNTTRVSFVVENNRGSATMTNELSETIISKKAATGTNELPGAILELLDSSRKSMSCDLLINGQVTKKDECKWTSGTTPMKIYGLKKGTYYLKEIQAPEGYVIAEEMVMIKIVDGITSATMINNVSEVKISKRGASGTNDLAGAKLEVLDANKNHVSCLMKVDGAVKNFDKCIWTSTTSPQYVYGLNDGTYFISELEAPKGYKASSEMVRFEISKGKAEPQVVVNMIKVTPTASFKSILSIISSALGMAIGISLLVYYKKRSKVTN